MNAPSNIREVGPERRIKRFHEHPRAAADLSIQQQCFETECSLGRIPAPQMTRLEAGQYTNPVTKSLYQTFELGWRARKVNIDLTIDRILRQEENPETRELLQRAYTKLRMEMS